MHYMFPLLFFFQVAEAAEDLCSPDRECSDVKENTEAEVSEVMVEVEVNYV